MCQQNSYCDFAYIYDKLTDDVEYQKRADYIESLIKKHLERKPGLLCDLGCGTGTVCSILNSRGYDCIGIDNSDSMLSVAASKNHDGRILFLNQDIAEFELYGTVDVFISMLDTVNYICNPEGLKHMFSLVNNYLDPGGIFIFDANTEYKFTEVLGNNTMAYELDDVFYVWENFYEDGILEFYLNFFVEDDSGLYRRFTEQHMQRYYSTEELTSFAESAGLTVEGIYADLGTESPKDGEERAFFVLKKPLNT